MLGAVLDVPSEALKAVLSGLARWLAPEKK
jgi:hypothetical protein